ncbi:uncharacterized protein [Panulirus ornatus]|uniref:uncharacterized protein n=1 Tax=Panulirus ornatus TaxID=150431 RepID=UPI003A8ADC48
MIILHRKDVASLTAQALEILGSGGNGTAYLVPWKDGTAVLKVSHQSQSCAFMIEASCMAYVKGAGGVPRVYAICQNPPSIVMSYLGRMTLQDVLIDNDPDRGFDLLQLGLLVGEGLQKLHKKWVIHNDLKSNNVMVGGTPQDPEVSIIDLGMACFKHCSLDLNITSGRCRWMAPEVRCGRPSTRASDVYSYAYLLREIFKKVYRNRRSRLATTVAQAMSQHPSDRPRLRNILKLLRCTIKRCLAARTRKLLKKPVLTRQPTTPPASPVSAEPTPIKRTPHQLAKPVK